VTLYLLTLELGRIHNKILFQKVDTEDLRTLATICHAPVSFYFTLPSETHDVNVESGSARVCLVPAALTISESEASLPFVVLALQLCGHCRTDLWAPPCLFPCSCADIE
jgi:hypothetical protein